MAVDALIFDGTASGNSPSVPFLARRTDINVNEIFTMLARGTKLVGRSTAHVRVFDWAVFRKLQVAPKWRKSLMGRRRTCLNFGGEVIGGLADILSQHPVSTGALR